MLCAFGADNYMKMANRLIKNIRTYDIHRPIVVLTNDVAHLTTFLEDMSGVTIKQFYLERHIHPFVDPQNEWNRYGLYPKLYQSQYSPFDLTMFIDVDMEFYQDFTFLWIIYGQDLSPITIGGISNELNRAPSSWQWDSISSIMRLSGLNIPQIFSTLMFYRTSFQEIVKRDLNTIFENRDTWHLEKKWRESWPDEIFISILMAMNEIRPSELLFKWISRSSNVNLHNKIM